jgi:hypothetical protein
MNEKWFPRKCQNSQQAPPKKSKRYDDAGYEREKKKDRCCPKKKFVITAWTFGFWVYSSVLQSTLRRLPFGAGMRFMCGGVYVTVVLTICLTVTLPPRDRAAVVAAATASSSSLFTPSLADRLPLSPLRFDFGDWASSSDLEDSESGLLVFVE